MFSPDGSSLAVGYCNTFISLVDFRSGAVLRTFTPEWQETTGFTFSPDGSWLAAFGQFGHVAIWNVKDGKNILTSDPVCLQAL
jgi:WD40 repeat protein